MNRIAEKPTRRHALERTVRVRSVWPTEVRLVLSMASLVLLAACGTKSPTAPDGAAIAITSHPANQLVATGSSATLAVEATGGQSLAYQWYRGGAGDTSTPVAGATAASYTTPPLSATTRYWVRVSEEQRSVDSTTATIEVAAAPSIQEPPEDVTITPGQTATIFVEAAGGAPLGYQWYRGNPGETGDPIAGATGASYTTPVLTETARFWVRVSNAVAFADSPAATVTVAAPSSPPDPSAPNPPAPNPPGTPPMPPAPPSYDPQWAAFENDVLAIVNQRRSAGAICGGTSFAPVAALYMHGQLREAARGHSLDMASRDYLSHRSQDGRTFSDRISAAGYGAFPRGENIAAGYSSPTAVVNGWMAAPEHCRAIMNGSYRATGVGYAYRAGTAYGHYWTQDFGAN